MTMSAPMTAVAHILPLHSVIGALDAQCIHHAQKAYQCVVPEAVLRTRKAVTVLWGGAGGSGATTLVHRG